MAQKIDEFDVIIIGGGPGGLSAALWCAELGLNAILLEKKSEFGGQLLRTYNAIKNHLGADAANGRELRDIFLRQAEKANFARRCDSEVVEAELTEKKVVLADGSQYRAHAIVIATGVSRRKLDIPGEAEFYDRGILESGEKAKNEVAGKRVMIVGGGDAALENALILARVAERVFVVHRRSEFSARDVFLQGCLNNEKIEFILNTRVTAIVGNTVVDAANIEEIPSGNRTRIAVDAVLIRVGEVPNTELFRGQIALDAAGFIIDESKCLTDLPDIYAIGDVANPLAPTISAAVGMGATVAKSIIAY